MADERDRDEASWRELRRAWQDLRPPALADAIEDADERTRATVDWMRAAWLSFEVPVPARAPRADAGGRLLRFSRRAAAVAAGLFVLASAGLFLFEQGRLGTCRVMSTARDAGRADRSEDRDPRGEALQVAAVTSDQLELRSGPVRLILMTEGPLGDARETR